MQTRSSSKLTRDQTSNPTSSTNTSPKGRTRRSSKQKVENSNFEEHLPPIATMADNHTMAEMLRAPTEGCAEAIIVPSILAEQLELKYSLINMMTSEQFFGLEKENPHDHIRWGSPPMARKRTPADRCKDLLRACPHYGFTELHQLDTCYNALNPAEQDSLNAAAGGNLLEKTPVKAVEEICVTYGGAHPYYKCLAAGGNTFPEIRDNIQGYVSAAACNYNKGNPGYRPQGVANQMRPPGSGSLPSNTVANPKGELKSITTHSGLVTDGPTIPTPPKSITPEVGERVEETYMDLDLAEYTIKVPPPPVQKYKPPSQRDFVVHKRDSPHPNIPYPSRMLKQKQQEKDEVQIQKFWQIFKQLHLNITLAEALVLMPKYQKMLKALLSNKEKLQELANTPLNKNCSAVILKKLPEKLGDPGKFLIPCGFSELQYKALADLGASINLMPLSVWKELGLPELIPPRITLELANRAICTPAGIARDVFVPVGKFTFPADFFVVDCESDPRVPLILGIPFLSTARALIDVHGEEMILYDGDERLILNMKHDTASYSNHPQRESVNLINIFNVSSEDFLEVLVSNETSGNPTFSLHQELTSPEVTCDTYDSEGCNILSEKLPDIDSINDIHPHFEDNPLRGSTTYSSNSLLEEFTDELALITYPPDYDDNLQFDIESDLKEIEFLLYQGKDSNLKDSIDQTDLANLEDYFVDPIPEMFTDEHAPDYSSPSIFDVYEDDFLEIESDADNVYDNPFDSKGEKIKESKLLIDELDLPCDFLPYFEYDSFNSQDFSRVDALPSTNNEDKYSKPENPNELFQKLLEDLKELAEYENSQSRDRSNFLNDNEEHYVQNEESLENSSNKIVVSNSNQEKEEPPQDSDIRQLIREECCVEVSEEKNQKVENTILDALNSKLLLINSNSQRLDKEEQEVKNVVEQPIERGNRIESLQNFRVIHKSSISSKNTSQISSIHAIAPILSTKEPEYSSSMGYENPNTTLEMESNEIIKSGVEELVPILSENEVTPEDKRECDLPIYENSPVCDDHSDIFSDSKNDDDISSDDDDFEDVEYVDADPEIVSVEEENVVHQEKEDVDLEDISQIQDVVLRKKLLSITRLISNIESLNDNPTPDCVLDSFESDNSLSDNFLPEFETICDHTKETRSGNTTTHADNSLPEYDSFCFDIEPDQERLINILKSDIPNDSSNDPLLEEADSFLASDNSIPPGIENVADDSKGDIHFLEELLIDDSILSHESSDSNFEDNPSIPRPPPKPPDAEFDAGEEIPVVMNDKDNFDEDYYFFMFVKVFSFLFAESEDTIFDPEFTPQ
nr:reverse transcriptase domain-containing protein [Tanacetum cinerariifolium]